MHTAVSITRQQSTKERFDRIRITDLNIGQYRVYHGARNRMANGDRFRFQRISFVVLNLDKMRINARDTTDKVVRLCSGLQSTKELWNRHSISIQKRAESGRTVKTACVTIIVIMVSMIGD